MPVASKSHKNKTVGKQRILQGPVPMPCCIHKLRVRACKCPNPGNVGFKPERGEDLGGEETNCAKEAPFASAEWGFADERTKESAMVGTERGNVRQTKETEREPRAVKACLRMCSRYFLESLA